MSKHLKASVLIDTYNQSAFIEQAVQSALDQSISRDEYEVIVVDDGSTDDTQERLKRFGDSISYYCQSNGGQSKAFNTAINAAKGEYLVLLDGDDYCLPTRVERVIEEFEKYDELVYVLNGRRLIGTDLDMDEFRPEVHNLGLNRSTVNSILECSFGTSRLSIRKSALEPVLPIPEGTKIGADIYLTSLLWFGNMSSIREILSVYRVHDENLFHTDKPERIQVQIDCLEMNIAAIAAVAKNSPTFDSSVLVKMLRPFNLMLKQFEYAYQVAKGNPTSRLLFDVQLERFKLYAPRKGMSYKIAKMAQLPIFFVLPHSITTKLQEWWSTRPQGEMERQ